MKKIFVSIISLFVFALSAQCSEAAIGTAQCDFSTAHPSDTFQVKLEEAVELDDGLRINSDSIVYGKVIQVEDGLRGKRQGNFEFHPEKYITSDGEVDISKKNIVVKVSQYEPVNKKEFAKKAVKSGATTVAGKVLKVPFISQGVSFVKGAAKADEDENMLVEGAKQVYKDSPLSYVEKGESLVIQSGEQVKLKFTYED